MTGMAQFTKRLARDLSGGMKQKLGLACALARPAPLLLLDEATVGVDPVSRRELWSIVYQAVEKEGMSVLLSTAYLDEAERCEEVILIHGGEILGQGPPGEFTERAKGRSFRASDPGMGNRALQQKMLDVPGVVDSILQGEGVRVVMNQPHEPRRETLPAALENTGFESVPPRFEDSFIAMIKERTGAETLASSFIDSMPAPSADGQKEVITVENVKRRFGSFYAVKGISFSVRRGEVFGLLGANGAGKSTTFRMLCGLLPPTEGALKVAGQDLRRAAPKARAHIGYMAQRFSLYANLSVMENLRFFSAAYGLRGKTQRDRLQWALEAFELGDFAQNRSGDLPLGYKQRLAMAATLMHQPEIIFLDEPTSGVDPVARREFWYRISALAEQGVTALVTTHFMEEAEYCDRVVIMAEGEILADGAPKEMKKRFQSSELPEPTMEDAFIGLIEDHERTRKEDSKLNGTGHNKTNLRRARGAAFMRLRGLAWKESLQIVRDPSSIAIAFVLPFILLLLFGYGVSLDAKNVPIALVEELPTAETASFTGSFYHSPYFIPVKTNTIQDAEKLLKEGTVRGIVWLRSNFGKELYSGESAPIGLFVNGVDANTARLVQGYTQGVWTEWLTQTAAAQGKSLDSALNLEQRVWFNSELRSRNFLVPGLIAVIMTLIGALLTAMVVAREWERGTMEALMVTPVSVYEILLGKLIPYFILGMGGMCLTVALAVWLFEVPLRGSVPVLFASSAIFLITTLGLGLLISTVARSQFVAGQVAIIATFLPAFILSGFIFDIGSMPEAVQFITYLIPARYFVAILQSVFLAGDVWPVILGNSLALCIMSVLLLGLVRARTRKRLD